MASLDILNEVTQGLEDAGKEYTEKFGSDSNEQKVSRLPPIKGGGGLLEEKSDKKVFKTIHREVLSLEPLAKNNSEIKKHWDRIRRGIPFAELEKKEDRSIPVFKATLPPGINDSPDPIPNEADDLCAKVVNQVHVDPFIPDPKPSDPNSEPSRNAANITRQFLRDDGDVNGTDDGKTFREACDINISGASSFVYYWVDPKGGGWRPKFVLGHPQAPNPQMPLVGPDGKKTTDPVPRYVDAQGNFVDSPAQADRQWIPKHKSLLLDVNNVRILPASKEAHEADEIILVLCETLGEVKRRSDVVAQMQDNELQELASWRPPRWKSIVPQTLYSKAMERQEDESIGAKTKINNQTPIFFYLKFCRSTTEYPDGAEIMVSGANDGMVLKREKLRVDREDANGKPTPVLLDIPVIQFKCLRDPDGNPMGRALIERFGGANAAMAHIYGAVLNTLEIALNPNIFLASTSPIQAHQLQRRDGTPIPVISKDDMPEYEKTPELPAFTPQIIKEIKESAQKASGLSETAMSLDSSYSTSGVAKEVSIKQAKVAISEYYQNTSAAVKRCWRIKHQLAVAYFDVTQKIEYTGINASYQTTWWNGSDIIGIKPDIGIKAGSGTMMAPTEKQAYVATAQDRNWMSLDEAQGVIRSTLSDDLGLEPNVHEERISREISEWIKGPPEGWAQQYAQYQEAKQAFDAQTERFNKIAQLAQAAGTALPPNVQQPQMPQVPEPWTPFVPRSNDEYPEVAAKRYSKLSRLVSTVDYEAHIPEWRSVVDVELNRMAYANGVFTMRQRQEMQKQQAATQAATAKAQQDREEASEANERDGKKQEAEAGRQHEMSMEQQRGRTAAASKAIDSMTKIAGSNPVQ